MVLLCIFWPICSPNLTAHCPHLHDWPYLVCLLVIEGIHRGAICPHVPFLPGMLSGPGQGRQELRFPPSHCWGFPSSARLTCGRILLCSSTSCRFCPLAGMVAGGRLTQQHVRTHRDSGPLQLYVQREDAQGFTIFSRVPFFSACMAGPF